MPSRHSWMFDKRGMTLVELLTSLMVASIVMVALLQSLTSASDSWVRQSKSFSAQREARVAMRKLTDDLTAIQFLPAQPGEPGYSAVLSPRTFETPGTLPEWFRFEWRTPGESLGSDRFAFLRAASGSERTGDGMRGDLRLVMYGVVHGRDGAASGLSGPTYSQKLVRRELTAEETFRRLTMHLREHAAMLTQQDWQALEEVRDEPGVATASVVAHDVIRFFIRPVENLLDNSIAPGLWQTRERPIWLDVTLRVTNRQTGQFLQSVGDWMGLGERSNLILNGTPDLFDDDPEVRTFAMRLRLSNQSL